jgi:predicted DsbA family dithiol-disulfide isomerase
MSRDSVAGARYHVDVMQLKVTYYLEVVSSWCYWAEPMWAELKQRYAGVAAFDWRIAILEAPGIPVSRAQEDWFYRRSGTIVRSPFMLNGAWLEPGRTEYLAPNAMAEAGRDLGFGDDRLRLALAEAAVRKGLKVGQWEVSAEVAAGVTGIPAATLLEKARSPGIEQRVRASTAEFHDLKVTQRPTFVLEDEIGDRAVFSGLVQIEPLAATLDAMLRDCAAYASWKAHCGDPPSV